MVHHSDADRPLTHRERFRLALVLVLTLGTALAFAPGCDHVPPPAAAQIDAPAGERPALSEASAVFAAQMQVLIEMAGDYPSVRAKVLWKPCGEENSYYSPDSHLITLCTEMAAHPDAALFFAAHEMGHAVTDQIADVLDEHDADEIGALSMLKHGRIDALMGAAIYWARQPILGHWPGDPHPAASYRAWELMCLADGSEEHPASAECQALFVGLRMSWDMRLSTPSVGVDDAAAAIRRILRFLE